MITLASDLSQIHFSLESFRQLLPFAWHVLIRRSWEFLLRLDSPRIAFQVCRSKKWTLEVIPKRRQSIRLARFQEFLVNITVGITGSIALGILVSKWK